MIILQISICSQLLVVLLLGFSPYYPYQTLVYREGKKNMKKGQNFLRVVSGKKQSYATAKISLTVIKKQPNSSTAV